MAELHDSLLPSELPIKNNFVYEKTALIDNIINNPHLKIIKSPFITKHVNLMKNTKHFSSRQGLIDVYEEQEQNSFSSHKISQNCNLSRKESFHIFVLNEIKESKNYKELVDEINSLQSHKQNSFFFKKKLLRIKAQALIEMNRKSEAIECYEEFINLDPNDVNGYYFVTNLITDFKLKLEYIEKAIEVDPYNYNLYRIKADIILLELQKTCAHSDYSFSDVICLYKKSIKLNDTVNNFTLFRKLYVTLDKCGYTEEIEEEARLITAKYPLYSDVVIMNLYLFFSKKES